MTTAVCLATHRVGELPRRSPSASCHAEKCGGDVTGSTPASPTFYLTTKRQVDCKRLWAGWVNASVEVVQPQFRCVFCIRPSSYIEGYTSSVTGLTYKYRVCWRHMSVDAKKYLRKIFGDR